MRGKFVWMALFLAPSSLVAAQEATTEGDAATQVADPSRDSEARALFEAGVSAYDGGRYGEALDYFQRSYDLSGRPGLLHNIGSAAERARRDELALRSYEEYLRLAPDAPNRPRVETRIAALRRLIEQGSDADDTADADPSETPAGPPESSGGGLGPVPWVLIASGGAVTVAGAVLLGIGLTDQATVEDPAQGARWEDAEAAYDRGPALLTTGVVLLPLGVAALGVGVVLAVLPGGEEAQGENASLRLGPGSITWRGRF